MLYRSASLKNDESNLIYSAQQFISSHNIKITPVDIEQALLNHPNYPSIASFTDLLDQYNVDNVALKTTGEHLDKMDLPALIHLNENGGRFALLSECNAGRVTYEYSVKAWKTEVLKDFEKKWSGTIVMADASSESGDPEYKEKLSQQLLAKWKVPLALFVGFALLLLGILHSPVWQISFLLASTMIGVVNSVLLESLENNPSGKIAVKLCSPSKNISCQEVLSSPAAKIFGWLPVTNIGLIYFTGIFISILFGTLMNNVTPVLSIITLLNLAATLYSLYTLYYQYKVVKKWCVLCLVMHAILWAQFIVLLNLLLQIEFVFNDQTVAIGLFSFSIPVLHLLASQKSTIGKKTEYTRTVKELTIWKRDQDIFQHLLKKQPAANMTDLKQELLIGSREATVRLTLVINPSCGPCESILKELLPLVHRKKEEIHLIIRFFSNTDDPLSLHLISLAALQPALFERALMDWYASGKNYATWKQSYSMPILANAQGQLNEHLIWCEQTGIKFTPTLFVGPYLLPGRYKASDLKFLLFN